MGLLEIVLLILLIMVIVGGFASHWVWLLIIVLLVS
jgi:hypothetical protein